MNGMFRHIKQMLRPIKPVFIVILMVGLFHPVISIAQEAELNFESVIGIANSSGGLSVSFTNDRIRISIGQPLVGRHSGGAIHGFAGLFYRIPQAPRLESNPVISALEDTLYSYQIVASDANGDSILYAVIEGPKNMQIDKFGLLLWTPLQTDVGMISVIIAAYDERGDSSFQAWDINVENLDDPPSKFKLSYPLGDTLNTLLPSFAWHPSVNVDPDVRIEYRLMISAFETLESPIFSELLTDTFYTLSVPSADDSLFFWSVMANNSSGQFVFSDTAWFLLDKQESPFEFSLISPENNSPVDSLRPRFTWFSSEDPDPRDSVRYTLTIISALDTDSVVYLASGIEDTTHQVREDLLLGDYKWFVVAEDSDEDSLNTQSREVFSLLFIVGVEDEEYARIPEEFSLFQNYPNPFNPTTTIMYGLPQRSDVTLEIYNIAGQLVARIQQNNLQAGYHEIRWNGVNQSGRRVASGIYVYRLSAGDFVETKKMLLLK